MSAPNPSAFNIRFKSGPDQWEPLTPNAEPPSGKPPAGDVESNWIICQAYRTLKQEIRNYTRGYSLGHSFLVAGHRGAGKTLLTHLSIQIVRWIVEGKITDDPPAWPNEAIPFLVPIHGPDILSYMSSPAGAEPDFEYVRKDGQKCERNTLGARPRMTPVAASRMARHAMEQFVLSLHRAFTEELLGRFRQRMEDNHSADNELAAQLTVLLNTGCDLPTLRKFWDLAGALKSGVLNRNHAKPDQGARELVALYTLQQAAAAIDQAKSPDPPVSVAGIGPIDANNKKLRGLLPTITPILSIAAGLMAAYVAKSAQSPLIIGVAFVFTAWVVKSFLDSFALSLPHSPFASEGSLPDLDRLAPILVKRVRDAGFAPIFVVDELDKIEDHLQVRLRTLLLQVNQFVTDRAFFCFLVDRANYAESMFEPDRHSTEQDFFRERLLIHYTPAEIHKHLSNTLLERPPDPESLAQYQLLRHLTLFSSRCRPAPMRQHLNTARVADRLQIADNGLWRVPGYRFRLLFQLAVEHIYDGSVVQHVLRQHPTFSPWILDTLYYPAHVWSRGQGIGIAGADRFSTDHESLRKYLLAQIKHPESRIPESPLADGDIAFLHRLLRKLVEYLEFPPRLTVGVLRSSPANQERLLLAANAALLPSLLTRDNDQHEDYNWAYDYYGHQIGDQHDQIPIHIKNNRARNLAHVTDTDCQLTILAIRNLPNVSVQNLFAPAFAFAPANTHWGILHPVPTTGSPNAPTAEFSLQDALSFGWLRYYAATPGNGNERVSFANRLFAEFASKLFGATAAIQRKKEKQALLQAIDAFCATRSIPVPPELEDLADKVIAPAWGDWPRNLQKFIKAMDALRRRA